MIFEYDWQDNRDAQAYQDMKDREYNSYSGNKKANKNNWACGYLGELGFERFLESRGVPIDRHPVVVGKQKETYDFIIGDRKIDVKSSQKYRDTIACNEHARYKAIKNKTILVGFYIDESMHFGTMFGRCEPEELERDYSMDYMDKKTKKLVNMYSKKF